MHNVVGVDAVKAHALCVQAARKGGGVVSPPLYGGVGGLNEPHTFIMDPEDNVFSRLLRPWLEQLCREMARDGFRAIIILTGHYGAAQQIVVRETAVRMSRALGIPVLGTPEYMLALDEGYTGDHAAWGETSLMMHLFPGTVDLSRLGEPPYQGVGGRDPKQSSAEDGRRITETIVSRLATLAQKMPTWNEETLDRFVDAEATLVAKQLSAPRGKNAIWTAWRNLGVMRDYGRAAGRGTFRRDQSRRREAVERWLLWRSAHVRGNARRCRNPPFAASRRLGTAAVVLLVLADAVEDEALAFGAVVQRLIDERIAEALQVQGIERRREMLRGPADIAAGPSPRG